MNLLDVGLLVALCDAGHVHHLPARRWFRANAVSGWATCPLTENGMLRVMGHTVYPGGPRSPEAVLPLLQHLRSIPGHQFWMDSISAADSRVLPSLRGVTARQLTDVYLLALAVHRGGSLATLDSRIEPSRVPGGCKHWSWFPAEPGAETPWADLWVGPGEHMREGCAGDSRATPARCTRCCGSGRGGRDPAAAA